jgi:1,4-dihydroxy-2-naphthoate polyprenyltransferase
MASVARLCRAEREGRGDVRAAASHVPDSIKWREGGKVAMMIGFARLKAFIRLGRPQFLIGGFFLYGLGAAVAVHAGAVFDGRTYGLGQLAITVIQLMTHYANDYFDFAADVANRTPTRFSGGSRVLPAGELSPRLAHTAAVVLALLAILLALAIGLLVPGGRGWRVAGVLLLAEALAWAYSAPPWALHSRGLGELTTALVVTGLTPFTGYLLQAGSGIYQPAHAERILLLALLPLAALQFNMLLTIEFPDAAGDAAVGKRTLVVRFGPQVAAALSRLLLIGVYGGLPLWVWLGLPPAVAFGCALGFPLAALQFWRLGLGLWADPARWQGLALSAVALLVITAVTEVAAFAWLVLRAA